MFLPGRKAVAEALDSGGRSRRRRRSGSSIGLIFVDVHGALDGIVFGRLGNRRIGGDLQFDKFSHLRPFVPTHTLPSK